LPRRFSCLPISPIRSRWGVKPPSKRSMKSFLLERYLDGKTELRGGSHQDRAEAKEWISSFWHQAVVREG
jgi:hypothetical protein